MIGNIVILDSGGNTLFEASVGGAQALADDPAIVSGFIVALRSFGATISGEEVSEISLGSMYFLVVAKADLIFAVAAADDNTEENKSKLHQIADLFLEAYPGALDEYRMSRDRSLFRSFLQLLSDKGIV